MKKRAFTLMEMLIAMIVSTILMTLMITLLAHVFRLYDDTVNRDVSEAYISSMVLDIEKMARGVDDVTIKDNVLQFKVDGRKHAIDPLDYGVEATFEVYADQQLIFIKYGGRTYCLPYILNTKIAE